MNRQIEPVDFGRWRVEEVYRIEIAQTVLIDLNTITDYKDKVAYLANRGFDPTSSFPVYKRGCKQTEGREWIWQDENGNEVEPLMTISLREEVKTEEQKAALNEALFNHLRQSNNQQSKLYPAPGLPSKTKPVEELIADYRKRFNNSPIKSAFVKGEVARITTKLNQLSADFKKAADRAYKSLLQVEPINWADTELWVVLSSDWYLIFVYDLVEYQIFLEKQVEELNNPQPIYPTIQPPQGRILDYNPNMFFMQSKTSNPFLGLKLKDIEQNIYEGDIPFTYIKGLLRFLKSTPQPFNLIQLQAYLYTIHPLSWYEGLLDEAVRYSFIKLVRDNGSITAKITTDLYVGVRFMLSKPLDKAAINSIIKEAEIKSDATISVIAGKLEDPLTLKTQNEKKAFLEECRDGFLQYYNDPTNPIYDYDVSNLDKLSNALSNQYQITIPDTFFTDDPQKYVSHIIFNAIANKLAIRKIIKFYTDKIEGLDKSQSTFDKSTLSQIFWPDAVSKFEEIEKQLWEHGYFTDLGAWKKKTITVTLTDLVKLIILLKEYGYFKKIGEGSKKLKETDYRAFFEKRYDCNINQQFSNRNIHDTGSIAQLFPFVKLLDIA